MSDDQMPAELVDAVPTTEPNPYPRYSLVQRKELIATLPWVARLDENPERQPTCQAVLSGSPTWAIALTYRLKSGMATAEERSRVSAHLCNRRARYVYVDVENRALLRCFMHAAQMLSGYSMDEEERYHAWTAKHPLEPDTRAVDLLTRIVRDLVYLNEKAGHVEDNESYLTSSVTPEEMAYLKGLTQS